MSDTQCDELFAMMVESVGIKAFAAKMDLSTRQIHRMLNGAQVNPIERACAAMRACADATGHKVLDNMCRTHGGYFVPVAGDLKSANLNAVKESAEAIVAISEGRSVRITIKEIREAIAALAALEQKLENLGHPKQGARQ
jgi:hypothetical protein